MATWSPENRPIGVWALYERWLPAFATVLSELAIDSRIDSAQLVIRPFRFRKKRYPLRIRGVSEPCKSKQLAHSDVRMGPVETAAFD